MKSLLLYDVVNAVINTLRNFESVEYASVGQSEEYASKFTPKDDNMEVRRKLIEYTDVRELDKDEVCEELTSHFGSGWKYEYYELRRPGSLLAQRLQVRISTDRHANSNDICEMICYDYPELTQVFVASGKNGYPKNLREAVIGLESYEQAQEIEKLYGVDIVELRKRDGWYYYERTGTATKPYSLFEIYCEKNNYNCSPKKEYLEYIDYLINEGGDDSDDDGRLTDFTNRLRDLRERVSKERDDVDFLYRVEDMFDYETVETVDNETMHYCYDVWTYHIGIYFPV